MNITRTTETSQIINQQSKISPLPRHIAIIMDGNGRWAQAKGKDRTFGHRTGGERIRPLVTECASLGIQVLTLYSFSTENWTRAQEEIDFLMSLYVQYLIAERDDLHKNNIRFVQIGRREGLPQQVLDELDQTVALTKNNTGMTLALALNYGSRMEITDAVRDIAHKIKAGTLTPDAIIEQTVTDHLYTAGLPDPDLLIRTAGEMRLSNYLLWQISYAELYVTDICWPEFDLPQLHLALQAFADRKRKFGAVR